jgi:hypothetical protein
MREYEPLPWVKIYGIMQQANSLVALSRFEEDLRGNMA